MTRMTLSLYVESTQLTKVCIGKLITEIVEICLAMEAHCCLAFEMTSCPEVAELPAVQLAWPKLQSNWSWSTYMQ